MASALVLAGGHSRRWGRDKAKEPLAGAPLLQHVVRRCALVAEEIIVIKRADQELQLFGGPRYTLVEDIHPETGALGGLYSGLKAASYKDAFAVACDMPFLAPGLIEYLLELLPGNEAVVPFVDGRPQPLCAAYSRSCVEQLKNAIEAHRLRLADFLGQVRTRYLQREEWSQLDPEGQSFLNLNTPRDLQLAESLLS